MAHTYTYRHRLQPSRYDANHYVVYLNEKEVKITSYDDDNNEVLVDGYAYTGTRLDGGTIIECDAWERNKIINGLLRLKYSQSEEDAIKTHRLEVLSASIEGITLNKSEEYAHEWQEFNETRAWAIAQADKWLE